MSLVYTVIFITLAMKLTTLLMPTSWREGIIKWWQDIDENKPVKTYQVELNKKLEYPEFDFN